MRRVFGYAASVDTTERNKKEGYAYTKYSIRTNRRNAVLLTVPSMFAIANASKREVFGETFNRMSVDSEGRITAQRILENSTTPRKSLPMPTVLSYLTPLIYEEMLINDRIIFRQDIGDAEKIAARTEEYRQKFANPFVAGARGFIDDVIMPHETRKRICRSLAMLRDKQLENPWRKHCNIPL
jgi:hypothetical protein